MGQYSSYYLYQKYEKIGSQDWIPCVPNVFSISGDSENPMSLTAKSECDVACGCQNTLYRWVNLDPNVSYYCDECPSSEYTFTWDDDSTVKNSYGSRMVSGGIYFPLKSLRESTAVGYRIESTEGWEGITDSRYLPRTGSSTSVGTYLFAGHPTNESGEDKQYTVTLVQNESGKRIYLFMTVQRKGAAEDFFYENTTATTINPKFGTSYPSTGYSQSIISHHNGTNTGFSISSDSSWLKAVNDGYVSGNDYYNIHYYPSGSTQNERSGTITLSQNGTDKKLYIVVTQSGTGCTTASTTCYSSASNASANEVAGTATANTVTWNWNGTRTTRTTACTSASTSVSGTASTAVTFTTNYGDSARTVSGTILWDVPNCNGTTSGISIPYSFVQRRACRPTTAYCYSDISNVTADDAPAAATSNTITWNYVGKRIVTDSECNQSETPISGSSSALVTMPMNSQYSAITVSGTYTWYVNTCDGLSNTIEIPYSFTQKSAGDGYVRITFYSSLGDLITIQRLIITYSDSSTRHYYTINSGPIYQGSIFAKQIWVSWSTSRRMSYMQAEYTINGSGTRTKYVKLPESYNYDIDPTFNFSSQYFQGGLKADFYITP